MNAQEIVIIGAGNLATHLTLALSRSGHRIKAIYNRTKATARNLADRVGQPDVMIPTDIASLPPADIYLLAISDDALPSLLEQWEPERPTGIVAHTAGSVSINILSKFRERAGVFYPLQTFSKSRTLDFSTIPCFVEAQSTTTEQILLQLGQSISNNVQVLDSEHRQKLHLAAVFACNFVNHLYNIATTFIEKDGGSPQWLVPLIRETAEKITDLHPQQAQTGPALRQDKTVMERHLKLLESSPDLQAIYTLLSKNIYTSFHP